MFSYCLTRAHRKKKISKKEKDVKQKNPRPKETEPVGVFFFFNPVNVQNLFFLGVNRSFGWRLY